MSDISLEGHGQLVRFFERQAQLLGLTRTTGLALAALYLAKYESGRKLTVDEVAKYTNYSRSNLGLILSQLEALGIVYSKADHKQAGRGRRRNLYTIDEDASSLIMLGIKTMMDRLSDLVSQIEYLMDVYENDAPHVLRMLQDFKKDASDNLEKLVVSEKG